MTLVLDTNVDTTTVKNSRHTDYSTITSFFHNHHHLQYLLFKSRAESSHTQFIIFAHNVYR